MLTSPFGNNFNNGVFANGVTNLGAPAAPFSPNTYGNNLGLLPQQSCFTAPMGAYPQGLASCSDLLSGAGSSTSNPYGVQFSTAAQASAAQSQATPANDTSSLLDQLTAILKPAKKSKEKDGDSDSICSDSDYDAKAGKRLAKCAKKVVEDRGSTTGECAKGVRLALEKAFGEKLDGADACDWADKLDKRSDFKKYKKSGKDLKDLPAGAIVVWGKTDKSPHGHISIADGEGNEISDHVTGQLTKLRGDKDCTVFIPV